ncbi:SirB2 family protein [Curvibacter sp. APW13]|uniref:SirB2 family protein n=1 Tax=Curvibacter sp. APW13 TaxID=3077236 RepID=UPI0028DFE917|nr:SirB2 family protein [Curvibacter sp. APW13]MDT8991878.1 SirB2 family protein [Curvibacter sp. APW13]
MEYAQVRALHIMCAGISVALFTLRWGLSLHGIRWRQWRWLRVAPHVNDAVLLGAAIALATWSEQYPWQQAWLGSKVMLLMLYIFLGKLALRDAQGHRARWIWGGSALTTVFSIITIARTRWPTGLL